MKKTLSCFLVGLMMLLCGSSGAFAAGAAVDNETLQLTLPHIQYAGQRYHVVLDFAGSSGGDLFWKLKSIQPTPVTGQCGGTVDANLNVKDICVLLAGSEYKVNIDFRTSLSGQEGLYWRLGNAIEPRPCTITRVKGGDECFDLSVIQQITQCSNQCGFSDVDCQERCFDAFSFQLSLEYTNSTPQNQMCVLPAGTIFKAQDQRIQNMLVIHGETFLVPAGSSKTICVPTYCLNSDRPAPDGTNLYGSGGGVTSPCMIEIIMGVHGKDIDHEKSTIQELVWDCANNGTISQSQRTYMQNLGPAN